MYPHFSTVSAKDEEDQQQEDSRSQEDWLQPDNDGDDDEDWKELGVDVEEDSQVSSDVVLLLAVQAPSSPP